MVSNYEIVLFYGYYLQKEDILKLAQHLPDPQLSSEGNTVKALKMDWFQERYPDFGSLINDINEYLESPVRIVILGPWNNDNSEGFWDAQTILVANMFHSVDDTEFIVPNLIHFDQDKETKLLQEAGIRHNIEWRNPAFYLIIDAYYGYRREMAYEGILFYGILIGDQRQFVKKLLEINHSYIEKWDNYEDICEEIWEKAAPEKLQELKEKINSLWDALERKHKKVPSEESEGLKKKLDEEEKALLKSYNEWLGTIFNSPEFWKWELDDQVFHNILDGINSLFDDLNEEWGNDLFDSISIGSLLTNDKPIWYLGIRSTRVYAKESNGIFWLNAPDLPKWDHLLRTKCAIYNIEFKGAHYYILRNDLI